MENFLGEIIYDSRLKLDMTQDQYGAKYNVSGPAVFKFEKGFVRPSLELWLQMAADAGIPERRAVILWLKSKLPREYQDYLELPPMTNNKAKRDGKGSAPKGPVDYANFEDREAMRDVATKDRALPRGLQDLIGDEEVWSLTRPTGHEINLLRDMFGRLGRGNAAQYREALRLIREFTHSF